MYLECPHNPFPLCGGWPGFYFAKGERPLIECGFPSRSSPRRYREHVGGVREKGRRGEGEGESGGVPARFQRKYVFASSCIRSQNCIRPLMDSRAELDSGGSLRVDFAGRITIRFDRLPSRIILSDEFSIRCKGLV